MSATRRILSGNIAAWCGILINLLSQIFLVPVYLSHWDKTTYGLWLTLQSLINMFEIFDYGHHGYLQNEFLRVGVKRRRLLRKILWSSCFIGFCLGFIQLLIVTVGCATRIIPVMLGIPKVYVNAFSTLLILNIFIWWLTGSVLGITGRLFSSMGYYARFAWWGVLSGLLNIAPAMAVIFGGGIKIAGIVQVSVIILYNTPLAIYKWRLLLREGMSPVWPNFRLGLTNLARAQIITATSFIDMVRQDGIRVLLAPLAGAGATAAFTTMRTGANVVQQGVGTVTGPIMPELMHYLNRRDQERSEAAFGTIWIVLITIMAPGAVLLQLIAPRLFAIWTRGKIDFDPPLFATLTLSVLIYATVQPAVAVVQGNNILRARFILAVLTGVCIVGGMFLLIPMMGIRGAAVSLLLAEAVSAVIYLRYADRWMSTHHMRWPWQAFRLIILSVTLTGVAILSSMWLPRYQLFVAIPGIIAQSFIIVCYWRTLPSFARSRVAAMLESRLPSRMGQRLAACLRP